MADTFEEGGNSNPRTLRPEPPPAPPGAGKPQYVPPAQQAPLPDQRAQVFEAINQVGQDRGIKWEKDVPYVWQPSTGGGIDLSEFLGEGEAAEDEPSNTGKWVKLSALPPDDPLFNLWQTYTALEGEEKAAKDASRSGRAVMSYLESETNFLESEGLKTKEVQRQFKDFVDRAQAVYGFQNEEQAYSMRADDQNIQNREAQLQGLQNFNMTPFYLNDRPGNVRYSETVRPTVPQSILPDYQLNQAVGLPGLEGFNFANLPAFANGTDMAGIDPEIAPLIGMPLFAGGMFQYQPGEPKQGFPDKRAMRRGGIGGILGRPQ